VRVASNTGTTGVLKLDVSGAKEVIAADIECEAGFTVVNTDQPIATLAKGKRLNIEMQVEPGLGYVLARERKSEVIGEIPVDALFSPVVKVSYRVESTRVGRRTDFDKVVLNV